MGLYKFFMGYALFDRREILSLRKMVVMLHLAGAAFNY